jgi:Hypervirulence associated proteins TUDOR domain
MILVGGYDGMRLICDDTQFDLNLSSAQNRRSHQVSEGIVNFRRFLTIGLLTHFLPTNERAMAKTFKVGDHVSWNSEAGRVQGKIVKVHKKNVNYKGYIHHATPEEPQYEIKSDKTDHVALHKAAVLRRLD